jgi:hypothetical protein
MLTNLGRHVTADQRQRLSDVLKNVPLGQTYSVTFEVIHGCAPCEQYEDELTADWRYLPRWSAQGHVNDVLSVRTGLTLGWNSQQCSAAELTLIENGLKAADIPFHVEYISDNYCLGTHIRSGYCPLLVGVDPLAD